MHFVAIHGHVQCQRADQAVHADFREPFFADFGEKFAIVALTPLHRRCKDGDVFVSVKIQQLVNQFRFGVSDHLFAGNVGIGIGDAGEKEAQEVVNLGDGADGGSRVLVGGLLLDGDDGVQSRDFVHVGVLVVADELAGVSGEGLHVAPLPFGIDGVESERRLAAAA